MGGNAIYHVHFLPTFKRCNSTRLRVPTRVLAPTRPHPPPYNERNALLLRSSRIMQHACDTTRQEPAHYLHPRTMTMSRRSKIPKSTDHHIIGTVDRPLEAHRAVTVDITVACKFHPAFEPSFDRIRTLVFVWRALSRPRDRVHRNANYNFFRSPAYRYKPRPSCASSVRIDTIHTVTRSHPPTRYGRIRGTRYDPLYSSLVTNELMAA